MTDPEHPPTSQAETKEMLEDLAAGELLALLRGRGHVIEEVRWPDRERRGVKGQPRRGSKTDDLIFRQDGHQVGVDVIELHESPRHARQYAEMGRVDNDIRRELTPLVRDLSPGNTIAISWALRWLPGKAEMRAGMQIVRSTILQAAAALRAGDSRDLEPKPEFVADLRATCFASSQPTFGFVGRHVEQTGYVGGMAESMAESLLTSGKSVQLQAFDDARILAIDRAVMGFAEDLRDAIAARADRIPPNWTAIYFVVPWREPRAINEVWQRTSKSHAH